jgi:hypothetical protein
MGAPAAGLDVEIYHPRRTPEWREAWQVTQALIAEMNRELQAKGAKFLVVTVTNPDQILPYSGGRNDAGISEADLSYPDNRITTFCETALVQFDG